MSVFIGPLGGLAAVTCASSLSTDITVPRTFTQSPNGSVWERRARRGLRSWSLAVDVATPADIAHLEHLAGGYGPAGQLLMVDPDMAVTNLLTPPQAALATAAPVGARAGGPVALPNARAALASWVVDDPTQRQTLTTIRTGAPLRVPTPPDRRACTAAVDVVIPTGSTGRVDLSWFSANGYISDSTANATGAGGWARLVVTGTPPAGAISVALSVRGVSRIADCPVLTWTDHDRGRSAGHGVTGVVVESATRSVITAWQRQGGDLSSLSYTVREVGDL